MNTETWQNIIIGATFLIGAAGLVLSILNYRVAKDAQRNSLRERVFEKQFEFFMKFNEFTGYIETVLADHNHHLTDKEDSIEKLDIKVEELDIFVSQNELIIPDTLYRAVSGRVAYYYRVIAAILNSDDVLEKELEAEVVDTGIDLQLDIIDYLGLEKLSRENMLLARKSKFQS